MAYTQSPINFGVGTGSSPLDKNGDPKKEKKKDTEVKSTDLSLENVTYGVDSDSLTTSGTTYYDIMGNKIEQDIDEGQLSEIKTQRFRSPVAADRRFVTYTSDSGETADLYLSPPHDKPGHPGAKKSSK